MINIPMNTKPTIDLNNINSLNVVKQPITNVSHLMEQQNITGYNQTQQPMNYNQQPMNTQQTMNYNQQTMNYNQQPMNTQQTMNYNQQPMNTQQSTVNIQRRVNRPAANGAVLRKGEKKPITSNVIRVCTGWDIKNPACDLDTSAFMLTNQNKVIGDAWFVFYGQPNSPDNTVVHCGDNINGTQTGDDNIVKLNLTAINPNVQKIAFVITINEALQKRLNFSMVENCYVRIVDDATNQEIYRFNLTDYYENVTSMVVGEVYKHNNQWKFNAVGDGVAKDLAGLCGMYGVEVE